MCLVNTSISRKQGRNREGPSEGLEQSERRAAGESDQRERQPGVQNYIRSNLFEGTYAPSPVLRVEIPKPDGSKRPHFSSKNFSHNNLVYLITERRASPAGRRITKTFDKITNFNKQ